MKKTPVIINSVSELHRLLQLPKPEHPLVSFLKLEDVVQNCITLPESYAYNFYSICIKKDFYGKMKYGQNYYDFDGGVMTFTAPGQVMSTEVGEGGCLSGSWLTIHPDFMHNYQLAKTIKGYNFFSYAAHEALHLSDKEELMIENIMKNIEQEYQLRIDNYSQDVMISHIDLLLNYCNRFYNRQFLTRKTASSELLIRLEDLIAQYLSTEKVQELGVPTVQYLAGQLNISPNYLGDLLRSQTGQSTQHYIHEKLIEKAKEVLSTTALSVSEVAYQLGFEHPQSFSKLFKNKTSLSPLQYRHSFN